MQTKAYTPKNMTELFDALKSLKPEDKIIGGGTDLIIRLKMGSFKPSALLYMGGIAELRGIQKTPDGLSLGGMATMAELAASELMTGYYAALADSAADVGAVQIRNSATLGGNLMNLSPAGDLMPVWNLLEAQAEIACPDGTLRKEAVANIFLGPNKTSLAYNEAILRFIIPKPASPTARSAFVKLGYRKALTISRIGLAAILDLDTAGNIARFELVAGAISPTPIHVTQAEAYMTGKNPTQSEAAKVGEYLSELIKEVTPEMFDRDYKAAAALGVAADLFEKLSTK